MKKQLHFVAWVAVALLVSACAKQSGPGLVKHALALKRVPPSVTNIRFVEDAWTDYTLWLYFEIDPKDFPQLFVGRGSNHQKQEFQPTATRGPAAFPSFPATESYYWYANGRPFLELWTNQNHDRVHVVLAGD